jgi:hypothetical protein
MNVKRGFFRLWIGVSLCWIIGLGWYLRNDLHFEGPWTLSSPPLDCPKELPTENTRPLTKLTDKELECAIAVMEAQSWEERARATRFGSKPDKIRCLRHVCLAPDNGLKADVSARLFRANNGSHGASRFQLN